MVVVLWPDGGMVPDRSVFTNSERKWAERKRINPNPGLLLKD